MPNTDLSGFNTQNSAWPTTAQSLSLNLNLNANGTVSVEVGQENGACLTRMALNPNDAIKITTSGPTHVERFSFDPGNSATSQSLWHDPRTDERIFLRKSDLLPFLEQFSRVLPISPTCLENGKIIVPKNDSLELTLQEQWIARFSRQWILPLKRFFKNSSGQP
jgi:hypothetical protein